MQDYSQDKSCRQIHQHLQIIITMVSIKFLTGVMTLTLPL